MCSLNMEKKEASPSFPISVQKFLNDCKHLWNSGNTELFPCYFSFLLFPLCFWMQDLCHSHSDDATIQQKVSTIISCFINSSMPPALQIDIPPQQAQHILEKRHELGPYIFREAQVLASHVRVEHLQTFFFYVCFKLFFSARRCQCLMNYWGFGPSFRSLSAASKRSNLFLCCRRNESSTEPE